MFVACAMLLLVPVGAASIGMTPSTVTIYKGKTVEINLVLDEAPAGLAGYDLVVRLSNPQVAEFPEVTYPSWAALHNTTRRADGSVRISGVDLSREVSPGATEIPIATLTLRGISGGSSAIILESVNMDADGGDMITPVVSNGQVTVIGDSGSGGGGGGGSGGGSVSTAPRTSPTTTQPTATTSPAVTTTTPTAVPTSKVTEQVPATTHAGTPEQTTAPITPATPGGTGGIPFAWILGGIVAIAILFIVAFIAWRREERQG